MSSTRHAPAGAPLRQERYASSAAHGTSLGGLLVAKRCRVLHEDPLLAELLAFIQEQSLPDPFRVGGRLGSVEAVAVALLQEAKFQPSADPVFVENFDSQCAEDYWHTPTDADLAVSLATTRHNLTLALCNLALDPSGVPDLLPGLGTSWRAVLTAYKARCREDVIRNLAPTSITKQVLAGLRFCRETGKPALIIGKAKIGKSAAAKAFCAGSGGAARYVITPEDNDMVSLYRAIAKALGVADSPSKRAVDVRELVERTLVTARPLLVFDEAHNLFSGARRIYRQPQRILWVRRLMDGGVPIAFIALDEFEVRVSRHTDQLDWEAEQITDLISRKESLPERLTAADFEVLVERVGFDLSVAAKALIAGAANGQCGAQYVIDVIEVARYNAAKAGREQPSNDDVRDAVGARPSFLKRPPVSKKRQSELPRFAGTVLPGESDAAYPVPAPRALVAQSMHGTLAT